MYVRVDPTDQACGEGSARSGESFLAGPYDISVDKWKKSDLDPSIIAANLDTGKLYNYPNLSGTTLSSRVVEGRGWGPSITHHLVDWDSDGALDVFGQETSTGNMIVYRTDGSGNFIDEPRLVVGRGWGSMNEVESARPSPDCWPEPPTEISTTTRRSGPAGSNVN